MIRISNDINRLKGVVFHNDDVIGVVDNAESFLDMLCQIKESQEDGYRMEVDVVVDNGVRKTFIYRFDKNGKMIPSAYPNVTLWTDTINKKMLYLYNFSFDYNCKPIKI